MNSRFIKNGYRKFTWGYIFNFLLYRDILTIRLISKRFLYSKNMYYQILYTNISKNIDPIVLAIKENKFEVFTYF